MITQLHQRTPELSRVAQPAHVPNLVTLEKLAELWALPETWLREACRSRVADADKLPVYRLGRYVRVDLNSPELAQWLNSRRIGGNGNGR
jgi:hypothetical protein